MAHFYRNATKFCRSDSYPCFILPISLPTKADGILIVAALSHVYPRSENPPVGKGELRHMKNLFFPVIDSMATGNRIKRLRIEHDLTVRDLQDYFGFDAPQAIYKWQEGKTTPRVDNLIALGKLFGVPVESIIAVKAVAVDGRELIFVFRGKVSWVVCETEDYAAI